MGRASIFTRNSKKGEAVTSFGRGLPCHPAAGAWDVVPTDKLELGDEGCLSSSTVSVQMIRILEPRPHFCITPLLLMGTNKYAVACSLLEAQAPDDSVGTIADAQALHLRLELQVCL